MYKFRLEDVVKITSGKDKGREGKIEKIYPSMGKALVPGINVYKKHIKKDLSKDKKGGIYDIPRPIPFSNLALVCPKCKKITRVGFRALGREKKRVCRKCGRLIDTK